MRMSQVHHLTGKLRVESDGGASQLRRGNETLSNTLSMRRLILTFRDLSGIEG